MPDNMTVDERVVEMRIDNRQFVKGAEKTISVLDKLKAALNFKGASDDLEDLNKTSSKIDFSNMVSGVEKVSVSFNALEIAGKRAIENLTDSVYNFVRRTAKSLSTDQISAGWSKYESIMESTQTIMSATRGEWEENIQLQKDYADQLDYVNSAIERLNWFTDETSYNLTDMTSNIGKFTSIGESLDSATESMMGIATWAGLAGANATEASRAMYNISQAMGAGRMLKIDWKSIENAGMATEEFKQTAIEIAVAAGRLEEDVNGTFRTLEKGTEVTTKNFAETLSEGWFDTDVMRGTFKMFGQFSEILGGISDETGITATELLKMTTEFKEGRLDVKAWQDDLFTRMRKEDVPSITALVEAMETLSSEELDLGRRAFMASQESKTFTDAINATKDAVSTGWMNTFKYIFGDLDEAKKLWTSVTEELYDIFASGGERRNAIMSYWHDSGGRDALLNGLANIYNAVKDFVGSFKKAFSEIFSLGSGPDEAGEKLVDLTKRFEAATERFSAFMEKIRPSENFINGLKVAISALSNGVQYVFGIVKKAGPVFAKGLRWITAFASALFGSFKSGKFDMASFGDAMKNLFATIKTDISSAVDSVSQWLESFKDIPIVGNALGIVSALLKKIKEGFSVVTGKLSDLKIGTVNLEGPLAFIDNILGSIKNLIEGVSFDTDNLGSVLSGAKTNLSKFFSDLFSDSDVLREGSKNLFINLFEGLKEALKAIAPKDLMSAVKTGVFAYLTVQLSNFIKNAGKAVGNAKTYSQQIHDIFDSVKGVFSSFSKSIVQNAKGNMYLKMAAAIGILAGSIYLLSKVPDDKFMAIAVTLSFLFIVLSKTVKSLEKVSLVDQDIKKLSVNILPKMAANLIGMAIFLAVCVATIGKIAKLVNEGSFNKGLLGLFAVVALMVLALTVLSTYFDKDMGVKQAAVIVALSSSIVVMAIALSVLSVIPWQNLLAAAFSLGLVIAAFGMALLMLNDYQAGLGAIGAILAMAVAIGLLIPALAMLSAFGPEKALASAAAIAAIMLAMSFTLRIVDMLDPRKLATFTTGLIKFSVAVLLLSIALAVAAPAIITLTTAFVGMFAAFRKMDDVEDLKNDLKQFSSVCWILAGAAVALIAVGVALLIFGAAVLLAGAGVFLLSAGIALLAPAIALLATVLVPFGKALTEFCEMLAENGDTILAIISVVLAGVITIIIAKKLQMSMAVVSVILTIAAVLVMYGPQIMNALAIILEDVLVFLVGLVPMLVKFLVLGVIAIINGVANSLRNNMGSLMDALDNLVSVILEALVQVIFHAFGDLLGIVFGGLGRLLKKLGVQWDGIDQIGSMFKDGMDKIGEDLASYIKEDIVDPKALEESAEGYGDALTSGFDGVRGTVGNSMRELADSVSEMGDWDGHGIGIGTDYISGLGTGIIDSIPGAESAIDTLTSRITDRTRTNLDIHSPSRVAAKFGAFFDLGLAQGITDNVSEVDGPTNSLAERLKEALHTALLSAMNTDESLDLAPTITPVVDMSNVSESASTISSLFSGAGRNSIRIGNRISGNVDDLSGVVSGMQNLSEARANVSNDTYVVNVYPTPGLDEEAVANLTIMKLQNGILRKGASYG